MNLFDKAFDGAISQVVDIRESQVEGLTCSQYIPRHPHDADMCRAYGPLVVDNAVRLLQAERRFLSRMDGADA